MANTIDWGKATQNNTNGFGKYQNTINAGSIYGDSYAGETAIVGTSAAFLYSKSSYNQGEADPTPTITGTQGGSFNASANVVFVDTGTFNSSTGQIDLSATGIGSHIITYTVNGVQSGQTVGVTAIPYTSTSSFTFDGVDSYFDTGFSVASFSSFSVSAWVYANSLGSYNVVASQWRNNNTTVSSWFLETIGTNMAFGVGSGSSANYATKSFSTLGWHHIVGVWNGANVEIYIDSVASGSPVNVSSINTPTVNMSIGGLWNSGGTTVDNGLWNGNIDEVSIWNSALSSDAITEIYNSGAPNDLTSLSNASNTNLKAWYKF